MVGTRGQLLFFPSINPLVEKLGREFFSTSPSSPGAYLFLDKDGVVLYAGSSCNLCQRLSSYRYVKPDKASRKVVRLVAKVDSATYATSSDLPAACRLENEWIRLHRPRFNSINVHPETNLFVGSSGSSDRPILQWTHSSAEVDDWEVPRVHGAFRSRVAMRALWALLRLVWWRLFPNSTLRGLPCGWSDGTASWTIRAQSQGRFWSGCRPCGSKTG